MLLMEDTTSCFLEQVRGIWQHSFSSLAMESAINSDFYSLQLSEIFVSVFAVYRNAIEIH